MQMNKGTALAVALGSGYLLGRTKKLRLAVMVGGAIATGKAGGLGAGLLKRGLGGLAENADLGGLSPALGEISDSFKGTLADAAKAAAMAAITNKANTIADRMSDQAEMLRSRGTQGQETEGSDDGGGRTGQEGENGDDRRRGQAQRRSADDSRRAGDGRPKRPDQSERSDQRQSRGNGRRRTGASDGKPARARAER
jgi:hypothetical protein